MSGLFTMPAVAVRFFSRVRVEESGCWVWTGAKNSGGYGTVNVAGRTCRAHRFAFEFCRGPIAGDLSLDHLCRIKACVNPDHLEPVTHQENMRRHFATVTHCVHGHLYDSGNTRFKKTRGYKQRACLRCERQAARERYARKLVSQ